MFVWKSKGEIAREKQAEGVFSYMKWFYRDMFLSFFKTVGVMVLGSYLFRHRAEVKELIPTIPDRIRDVMNVWRNGVR